MPRLAVSIGERIWPDVIFSVNVDVPTVALTLDDGPDGDVTPQILATLRRYDAQATFFVLGAKAAVATAIIRSILDAGHEVGNHMWDDVSSASLTPDALRLQLTRTAALLGPESSRLFRPGSGWVNGNVLTVAGQLGYRVVLGSVYAFDAQLPCPGYVAPAMLRRVRNGDILVVHEGTGRVRAIETLDRLLAGLSYQGYDVTTVSNLTALQSTP